MSDANETGEESKWRRKLRIGAFVFGLIAILAGPVFHYVQPDPHVGWASMIAGLIFMVSSRFDDVVEIGFASFRTKLERFPIIRSHILQPRSSFGTHQA